MKRFLNYFSKRFLPRWVILGFDLSVLPFAYFLACLIRFNFNLSSTYANINGLHFVVILPIFLVCYYFSKTYSVILRHSTSGDVLRIISSMLCAGTLLTLLSLAGRIAGLSQRFVIPYSIIIIMILLAATVLILSRLLAKSLFAEFFTEKQTARKVMIFGAGKLGHITHNALMLDASSNIILAGFIDDNPSLHDKISSGTPIYSVTKAFRKRK